MNKLIKINNHYYIVDDSEIKEGDWYICLSSMHPKKCVKCDNNKNSKWVEDYLGNQDQLKFSNKITHSTQEGIGEQLNLNDIEELINGYSLEYLSDDYVNNLSGTLLISDEELKNSKIDFKEGFEAHKELSKEKLFTVDDMKNLWEFVTNGARELMLSGTTDVTNFENYIQPLLSPTEWNIEFQNGKIVLV